MSHGMRLGAAVCIALAAAALNWVWLTSEKKPPTYVAMKTEVPQGTEISAEHFAALPVPGNEDVLRKSLIPFSNRAVLLGLNATRSYRPGDVIFQRDIKPPVEPPTWEVVGPFQLIGVGERFRNPESGDSEEDIGRGGNNVTIAVPREFDAPTRRLLEVIDPNRAATANAKSPQIVAVQVVPSDRTAGGTPAPDQDVVYQTISLDGIENVPRILLEGDRIRFVLPGERLY
jgi:hypothetical protein